MVRSIVLLLFSTLSLCDAFGQWEVIHPATPIHRHQAYARILPGQTTWLAVGNDIARSDDAGITWQVSAEHTLPVVLRPGQKYEDILMLDDQTGFIAFEHRLFKTGDGGKTWTNPLSLQPSHGQYAYSAYFHAIDFATHDIGYAVGDFEKLFRTTDGGDHWQELSWSSSTRPFIAYTDVQFLSDRLGFIAGYEVSDIQMNFGFDEFLLITTDAGAHWQRISLPTAKDFREIKLHFMDAERGYVHLSRTQDAEEILYTADGGQSWVDATPADLRTTDALHWLPNGVGIAHGRTYANKVALYRTTDNGASWSEVHVPPSVQPDIYAITAFSFADTHSGMAVGAGGGIFVTHDGGATWEIANAPYPRFQTFDMADAATGYASAGTGFFKTTNGGRQWSFQPHSDSLTIYDMEFAGDDGLFFGWRNFYYHVTAGGNTVSQLQLPLNLLSIGTLLQKGDSLFACGMAVSPRKNFLMISPDRGGRWEKVEVSQASGLSVQLERSREHLYYGSGQEVIRSTPSGKDWRIWGTFPGEQLNGLIVLHDGTVLVALHSGVVMRRDPGSGTWSSPARFDNVLLRDFVADGDRVYLYGAQDANGASRGAIWISTDGGHTWKKETLPLIDDSVFDMDIVGNTVLAMGGYGQLLSRPLGGAVTGVETQQPASPVVFPVPVGETLYVDFYEGRVLDIHLWHADGVNVSAAWRQVDKSRWALTTSNLAAGMYVVSIQTERGNYRRRVVKY